MSEAHAYNLRNVWAKFGELYDRRELTNRTFNDCYVLARSSRERAEAIERKARESGKSIGTVDREHRDRDRGTTPPKERRERPQTRDEQIRAARDLLRDERNFDEVFRDKALEKRGRKRFGDRRDAPPPPPPPDRGEQLQLGPERTFDDLWEEFNHLLFALMRSRIRKQERPELMATAERFRNSVGWPISLLLEGDTSFEERLRELIGEPAATPPADLPAKRRKSPPFDDTIPAPEGGTTRGRRTRERTADEPGAGRRRG